VTQYLEAALRDLRSSLECKLGMKVWADALFINQADVVDQNTHILRVKDILGGAFSVTAWMKQHEAPGLYTPGERLALCQVILREYRRGALEKLLGVRNRERELMTTAAIGWPYPHEGWFHV